MVTKDDDAVVVVIDDTKVMTMAAGAAAGEDDPQYHHPDQMVIDQVWSKFLGFSFWSAAYTIFYSVGTIIFYWDVNKVGIIVSVIPPILVTCLLIFWVHTFAVKLMIDFSEKFSRIPSSHFCLINPNPNPLEALLEMIRSGSIRANVDIRFVCTSLFLILLGLMFWAQHAIRWDENDPNHNLRAKWVTALAFIIFLVSCIHRIGICMYLEQIITHHLKDKIKQPQPLIRSSINSTTTPTTMVTINQNQNQQQQQPPSIMHPNQQKT